MLEAMCKSIYGEGAEQVEGEKGEKGAEKDEEGLKTGGEHTPGTEEEDAEEGRPTIIISSMFQCVFMVFSIFKLIFDYFSTDSPAKPKSDLRLLEEQVIAKGEELMRKSSQKSKKVD